MPSNGLNPGYLDHWSLITALPSDVTSETDPGIQKVKLGDANGLRINWTKPASSTYAASQFGIKRTMDTEAGKTYALRGRVANTYTGAGTSGVTAQQAKYIAFRARGLTGAQGNVSGAGSTLIPEFVFQATASSTLVELVIANAITSGKTELARLTFYDLQLVEVESEYLQRFLSTSMDASLDQHFDLAANSVGGSWHVDRDNRTQFVSPAELLPISFVFSDKKADQALEYTDVEAAHDTRMILNKLTITNKVFIPTVPSDLPGSIRKTARGEGEASWSEDSTDYEWTNEASIAQYGERPASITTNIAMPFLEGDDWESTDRGKSYLDLIDKLTHNRQTPDLLVTKLVWNAQQDIESARKIELGQRIIVIYRGLEHDALIAGIQHEITPSRWMITLTLARP